MPHFSKEHDGRAYWKNKVSGERTWIEPPELRVLAPLPESKVKEESVKAAVDEPEPMPEPGFDEN